LLQSVTRLQIEISGRRSRRIDVSRSPVGSDKEEIALSTREAGGRPDVGRWNKWSRHWKSEREDKRLSVNAIALPYMNSTTSFDHSIRLHGALELLYLLDDGHMLQAERKKRLVESNYAIDPFPIKDL
jgi:hypothetical protein